MRHKSIRRTTTHSSGPSARTNPVREVQHNSREVGEHAYSEPYGKRRPQKEKGGKVWGT